MEKICSVYFLHRKVSKFIFNDILSSNFFCWINVFADTLMELKHIKFIKLPQFLLLMLFSVKIWPEKKKDKVAKEKQLWKCIIINCTVEKKKWICSLNLMAFYRLPFLILLHFWKQRMFLKLMLSLKYITFFFRLMAILLECVTLI